MSKQKTWVVVLASLLGLALLAYLAITKGSSLAWPYVERWLYSMAPDVPPSEEAKTLLADIITFRATSANLPPARAASDWVSLWERSHAEEMKGSADRLNLVDEDIGASLGLRSVIASLPPPAAWPEISALAAKRDQVGPRTQETLGLILIAHILAGDKANINATIESFKATLAGTQSAPADAFNTTIASARYAAARIYGTADEIAESVLTRADAQTVPDVEGELEVPDLVGLVGESKAAALLTQVLRKSIRINIREGDATLRLAQKIALANVDTLATPQWRLIKNLGNAKLYEAMQAKFDTAPTGVINAIKDKVKKKFFGDYVRQEADQYYFLDLVVANRHEAAEQLMERLASAGGSFEIPRAGLNALAKEGHHDVVYGFLAHVLERRPTLHAWDAYLQQAAYLNRAPETIALLDRLLKRRDLPASTVNILAAKRRDALLAADRVDEALAGLAAQMGSDALSEGGASGGACGQAIRIAKLGRVLKKPALASAGLDFAKKLFAKNRDEYDHSRDTNLRELLAELRLQGRAGEAKEIAEAEVRRNAGGIAESMSSQWARFGQSPPVAILELAGLADAAGDYAGVIRLLNEEHLWGVADIAEIAGAKDSTNVAIGAMAARALNARGEKAAAIRVTNALLDAAPGDDQGYGLALALHGDDAPAFMDARYTRDQFEERPLIWKGIFLLKAGNLADAERTVRNAIAIDPSDGEQGEGDRMRAYAVLADIVEAKGDAVAAKEFRRAVTAIRRSEKADELHKIGLYQRAFSEYRAAIAEFSDAYCIQSRLAVQLAKQGQHGEALKHYTRAYELMPDSFGRVESHCFGCESVFAEGDAQNIAERIFTDIIRRAPNKPQAHYMLGFLRKEQGRSADAVPLFRQAAILDASYLNAWKQLNDLGAKTYIEAAERDIARFRLLDLDPRQRHASYELNEVANLSALWERFTRAQKPFESAAEREPTYPLKASAVEITKRTEAMPPMMRASLRSLRRAMQGNRSENVPFKVGTVLANNALIEAALGLARASPLGTSD